MPDLDNRRPLASRSNRMLRGIASWLAKTRVTPNQISMAGMVFALIAGVLFAGASGVYGWARTGMLVLGVLFVQLRLLCNLFDGLVAVEGGKASPDGGFWNEFPDRVADLLILAGIGYLVLSPELGYAAAALAILTAYVRELGVNLGVGADFAGPMAKQHRMAVVSITVLLSALLESGHGDYLLGRNVIITLGLWIVVIGSLVTVLRRSYRLIRKLKARA